MMVWRPCVYLTDWVTRNLWVPGRILGYDWGTLPEVGHMYIPMGLTGILSGGLCLDDLLGNLPSRWQTLHLAMSAAEILRPEVTQLGWCPSTFYGFKSSRWLWSHQIVHLLRVCRVPGLLSGQVLISTNNVITRSERTAPLSWLSSCGQRLSTVCEVRKLEVDWACSVSMYLILSSGIFLKWFQVYTREVGHSAHQPPPPPPQQWFPVSDSTFPVPSICSAPVTCALSVGTASPAYPNSLGKHGSSTEPRGTQGTT